ncbi:MAG: TIR domain-containing protein [Rubrivivax sp.]
MSARPTIPFLLDLLLLAMRKEASAVYVVPWMPPTLRIDERSVPLSSVAFAPEQSTLLVLDLLDEAHRAALDRSREIQFSFLLDGVGRFRVHAFRRHGQPAMAIRPYALNAPTPRHLALPALVCPLATAERGLLVLASRSAGLRRDAAAALIEQRKRSLVGELALLDDASRFWHEAGRGPLHQGLSAAAVAELLQRRQARAGAGTPAPALAIAWGELRDGLLLEQVLHAAERALCLVTLDADGPLAALQRLITLSAEHGGPELLRRAALHLNAVLSLRPVPAAAGGADLAATEALANSPELSATLAEGDADALAALLSHRPQADEHLWQLLAQGLVTPENAMRRAADRAAFARRVAAEVPRPRPDAATAPVTVDTGFADLFESSAPMADPFDFAEAPAPSIARPAPDTQFDDVDWSGPESPPPRPDAAQFHAYAPAAVAPGALAAIDLWAALPGQAAEVAALARRAAGGPPPLPFGDTSFPAISVQLRIDGVLPSGPAQRLAWAQRPARVRFLVPVAAGVRPGAHAARVRLAVDGLPIGELAFVLQVRADAPAATAAAAAPLEDMQAARRMLQSAYAAFAPADREVVLDIVRDLQAVAPGLQVFADAPALRSGGEGWRERIEREMGRCERLFLFWSAAAAESPWVDFEWRLMLRRRGPGAIDALLLDPPRRAPLPPELADLASELRASDAGARTAAQPAARP